MSVATVAVIGGGMGGLAAAARLAQLGHAVTLFEADPVVGGKAQRYAQGGITLDTGPTLLTLPRIVRETFEGLHASGRLPTLHPLPLQCDYRFAGGERFQAFQSLEASAAQAEALQAGEGASLERFYTEASDIYRAAGEPYLEAPYEGMVGFLGRVARRGLSGVVRGARLGTLHALAQRCFRSPLLQQFAGRFATYVGASPFSASAAFALIAHLERAEGVHHVEGGMGALADALAGAAQDQGVTLRLGTRASWCAEGRGFRVATAEGAQRFEALVLNTDPLADAGTARASLSASGHARASLSASRPARASLSLSGYVLLLKAPASVPLAHHSVVFSRDYAAEFRALFQGEIPEDFTLYVCCPSVTDATMAPPGTSAERGLYVMASAPTLQPREDATPSIERLRSLCLGKLEATWPALRGRLTVLGERTPADFQQQGAPGGALYGLAPHGRFGPFRRPRQRGALPGLFYAGGGTHPGGGVPMTLLSGRFAAQLTHAHLSGGRA